MSSQQQGAAAHVDEEAVLLEWQAECHSAGPGDIADDVLAAIPPPTAATGPGSASGGAGGGRRGIVPALPVTLHDGPLVFLSAAQAPVCAQYACLATLQLPCWAPQRLIGQALGHSDDGVVAAVASLGGEDYVWAPELENVHSLWHYDEPAIVVDGQQFTCTEVYYNSQKPVPWDEATWDGRKEAVMEAALRAKLAADPGLAVLLRATGQRPLLSLKSDAVWGFDPATGHGENLLARIWMRLRDELFAGSSGSAGTGPSAAEASG